jgi:dihydroorotase
MKRALAVLSFVLLGALVAEPQGPVYDLLLLHGRVLDPASGRDGRFDVGISARKIARIASELPARSGRVVVDASGLVITPGLVDLTAHVFAGGAWANVNPDHTALRAGVTTVVDAGSTGTKNFEAFRSEIAGRGRVRVLAFLNLSPEGNASSGAAVAALDPDAAAGLVRRYPNVVVGVRAPQAGSSGWEPLERALRAATAANTIVLADPGAAPAGEAEALLRKLRPGDVLTHLYGLQTPLLDTAGRVRAAFEDARRRGVLFDLGHGSDGFWFRIAAPALAARFLPDTISTAMDKPSLLLPRAEMTATLSKLLNLGMKLEEVVERATVRPARALRRTDLGTLAEGTAADVAVFEVEQGRFGYVDSGHARLTGDRNIRCVLTVRDGAVVWDPDGRSRPDWQTTQYSNYR